MRSRLFVKPLAWALEACGVATLVVAVATTVLADPPVVGGDGNTFDCKNYNPPAGEEIDCYIDPCLVIGDDVECVKTPKQGAPHGFYCDCN